MPMIDSPQNAQVKLYRSLLSGKGRRQSGLCPLEGVRLIETALDSGADLRTVYVCPDLVRGPRVPELIDRLRDRGAEILELSQRAFISMADTEQPQGLAATAAIRYERLENLSSTSPACYLWLYELREPGNLGTMLRTAAGFSVAAVVFAGDCTDPYSPKAIRASAGAVFAVPLVRASWDRAMQWATAESVQTVASTPSANLSCHEAGYAQRVALIVGSEAHGLPEHLLTATDLQVKIPMSSKVESLNAGVAAGILLYTIVSADNRSGPDRPDTGCDGEK